MCIYVDALRACTHIILVYQYICIQYRQKYMWTTGWVIPLPAKPQSPQVDLLRAWPERLNIGTVTRKLLGQWGRQHRQLYILGILCSVVKTWRGSQHIIPSKVGLIDQRVSKLLTMALLPGLKTKRGRCHFWSWRNKPAINHFPQGTEDIIPITDQGAVGMLG